MSLLAMAQRYVAVGLAVVPLPPRSKAPNTPDWQNNPLTDWLSCRRHWIAHPDANVGILLGRSRLCSLDIDDLPAARIVLSEWGIDLDELVRTTPTIRGKAEGCRLEFRVPEGVELTRHSLTWPRKDDSSKRFTVLELRAGAVQDVFPPSIHPDTQQPYIWVTKPEVGGIFPELPERLLTLWKHWSVAKAQAEGLCPWGKREAPVALSVRTGAKLDGESAIAAWNAQADICRTLEQYNYERHGRRYLSPHSSTKLAGVEIMADNRCWIHHASDPLCTDESGHPVNCFDLFCYYEHGNDVHKAVGAVRRALGLERQPSKPALAVVEADGSLRAPAPVSNPETEELPAGFSQDAIAAAFTAKHGDWRYVSEWGKWYCWDGQRWAQDTVLTVFDLARTVCREQAAQAVLASATAGAVRTVQSANTIAAVERIARSDKAHASRTDTWDADPWLLNTPGGVVDLQDGSLRPGTPDEHMTKITQVAPGGDCPLWRQFLSVATGGDIELEAFMQRMAGYCLTGITREHALFFVYGTGGNGKGTFLNMLNWIMGDYGQVASMETFTEARGERHPTELAGLMGARMVSAQETEEGRRWAESRIKALTGGDPIRARFMRQDEFTFMPQFKLVIVGNHKPGLRNVDDAIKRRLHLIPFVHKITAEQKDVRLPEKLQAEAGAILQWAVAGCLEWQRIGLAPPECVKVATEQYLSSQDSLATWMGECCEIAKPWSAKVSAVFESYRNWAEKSGEATLGRKRFSEAMETRGFVSERFSGNYVMRGIRVAEQQSENGL